jgi:hypothetical protein
MPTTATISVCHSFKGVVGYGLFLVILIIKILIIKTN